MSMFGRMAMWEPIRLLELFTSAGRRRRWSQDKKAAIVAEGAASNIPQQFTSRHLASQEEASDRCPTQRCLDVRPPWRLRRPTALV
jgi:hypothetical protein